MRVTGVLKSADDVHLWQQAKHRCLQVYQLSHLKYVTINNAYAAMVFNGRTPVKVPQNRTQVLPYSGSAQAVYATPVVTSHL